MDLRRICPEDAVKGRPDIEGEQIDLLILSYEPSEEERRVLLP